MGLKVYISGISGNKEVKKRQQRVLMILDSRRFEYSVVDITEPGREPDRDFMQEKSTSLGATVSDLKPRHPLPPQIFYDEEYCGDYDQFDLANENDEIEQFLKLSPAETNVSNAEITLGNGTAEVASSEPATPAEADSTAEQVTVASSENGMSKPDLDEPEVESSDQPVVESTELSEERSDAEEEEEEDEEEA